MVAADEQKLEDLLPGQKPTQWQSLGRVVVSNSCDQRGTKNTNKDKCGNISRQEQQQIIKTDEFKGQEGGCATVAKMGSLNGRRT